MKKTIMTIVLGIFLISFASAIYGGECEQLDLSDLESLENVVYIPVGNSSNLEGLNVSLNGNNVNICPALNYKPDNFTLVFWDNSPEVVEVIKEVHHYSSGGGGGSRTKYIENKTYIEVPNYISVYENITEEIPIEIIKEIEIENKGIWKGWKFLAIVLGLLLLFLVIVLWNKSEKV